MFVLPQPHTHWIRDSRGSSNLGLSSPPDNQNAGSHLQTTALRNNCGYLVAKSGEGNGTPLRYSCLENTMDGGAWWAAVHGVAKCWTWLSDFTFTFHFHALEKEMATHSRTLAWRIPGTGEPGGLLSMGSHRVGHDWCDLAAAGRPGVLRFMGSQRVGHDWATELNWTSYKLVSVFIHIEGLKQISLIYISIGKMESDSKILKMSSNLEDSKSTSSI